MDTDSKYTVLQPIYWNTECSLQTQSNKGGVFERGDLILTVHF